MKIATAAINAANIKRIILSVTIDGSSTGIFLGSVENTGPSFICGGGGSGGGGGGGG